MNRTVSMLTTLLLCLPVGLSTARAVITCDGQPWCTIGQCDPTSDVDASCDREVAGLDVSCTHVACTPSAPSIDGSKPPSNHFLNLLTSVVYQQTSGGLVPIGSSTAGTGYAVVTTSNWLGACSTSGATPCPLTYCGARIPPVGILCVEYNVQLVGCHAVALVFDEYYRPGVIAYEQTYPKTGTCTQSGVGIDPNDPAGSPAVRAFVGANDQVTSAYERIGYGSNSYCYASVSVTLRIDNNTVAKKDFSTTPLPYCQAQQPDPAPGDGPMYVGGDGPPCRVAALFVNTMCEYRGPNVPVGG